MTRSVRHISGAIVLVLGLAVLTACGGDASSMSGEAARELNVRVGAVRTAVVARDAGAAERALDDLRTAVDRLRGNDELSDGRAADILAAAHAVDDQLASITTTTTTTTTTITTSTTVAPPVDDHGAPPVDDHGDKGNGKGKGKGKGDKHGEG